MKRTILSPRDAAWLAETFARNTARFGGWSMEATDDDKGKGDDDKPTDDKKVDDDKPSDDKGGDKPLGENGEKALRAEREERKKLETQLADLKKGLLGALGGTEGDDGKDDADAAIAKIQQRLDDMQHQNAVLAVANEHRITDKDDLALLGTIKDVEAMKKLAERLAPSDDDGDGRGRRPKPDRSQGGGDGSDSRPSVAAGRDMFAASRKKKSA